MITAKNAAGQPVMDAVVTVYPNGKAATQPFRFPWPARMAQQNIAFDPYVLIVPVGTAVSFPNLDKVRHHVYSFSPGAKFELKLFGHDETRTQRFDNVGVAALGCNIHDRMIGFIKVVDTPYAAKTDAAGQATIRGVPAGPVVARIWHPYQKGAQGETVLPLKSLPEAGARQTATLDMRPGASETHTH